MPPLTRMTDTLGLLPLVPLLPAAGALLWGLIGRMLGGRLTARLATATVGLAFLCALGAASGASPVPQVAELFTWISVGAFRADAAFLLDPLSAVMIVVVTGVGLLIHVYSIGYMAEDRHLPRYFAYLNLFMAAMLVLVLADNLLLMFVGWEGVGLCSYLLIGFWFEKKSASDAGKKAFIVNRVGDFGFVLAILLTFVTFGSVRFLEFLPQVSEQESSVLTTIALLFFWGATGKSAQIPLHVWLPDAMEGPTPVSALIHAATMVTAGVYLVARTSALFVASPVALALVGAVGAATAVFAASMALVQDDFKRVLAYSTISQLGYMFLACGVGAFSAAIFHLVTHAFFKALLFLCAGSVMHALSNETDIRRMGGLSTTLPVTSRTFWVGAAALGGFPFLSGFWSKDEILWSAFREGHYGLWLAGAVGAFLTAFYVTRLWYVVFRGEYRGEEGAPPHESPRVMRWPLWVLAGGAFAVGLIGIPHLSWIEHFLAPSLAPVAEVRSAVSVEVGMLVVSVGIALSGFWLARRFYVQQPTLPAEVAQKAGSLYTLVKEKYRVDELYNAVFVRPLDALSRAFLWRIVDARVVDGIVNGAGRSVEVASELLRLIQSGNARFYLFFVLGGTATLFGWFFWK